MLDTRHALDELFEDCMFSMQVVSCCVVSRVLLCLPACPSASVSGACDFCMQQLQQLGDKTLASTCASGCSVASSPCACCFTAVDGVLPCPVRCILTSAWSPRVPCRVSR
jgi:hypothetical protein